ncbi:MAG: hypothetical protein HQK96_05860 [Nitrospirae bacterium]|nr:hypothetical protein [Nitrospirota bacterium]MBF0554071.1 hypothetical protein [Nitrospirota bacterium]
MTRLQHVISFRVDDEQYKIITQAAKKDYICVSAKARAIILKHIDKGPTAEINKYN